MPQRDPCSLHYIQGRHHGVDWGRHVHPTLPDGVSETGADLMSLREGMQLADLIPKSSSRHTYPTFRSETPLISNASSSPDQPEDLPAIISLHDAPSHTRLVSNFFCDTNFSAYSVH